MTNPIRLIASALALLLVAVAAPAQRRGEYMTEGELDMVRDIRRIDHRAEVFLKVADRRLIALGDPNAQPKDKLFERFGPLPKGSQIDLLDDYKRTVEELELKFEDEYERTGVTKEVRAGLEFAAKEVERQIAVLEGLRSKLTGEDVDHYVDRALAAARELRDGAKKALDANPAPPEETKDKKKN